MGVVEQPALRGTKLEILELCELLHPSVLDR